MKLKRLAGNEKDDKKKKSHTLKVIGAKDTEARYKDGQSESDEDMDLIFKKIKEFLRQEKKTPKF